MKFKPNTVLPPGARMLRKPVTRTIGGWVEMQYDAYLILRGIIWYRAKDGFGDSKNREDWVANLPFGCCHLERTAEGFEYNPFMPKSQKFSVSARGEIKEAMKNLRSDQRKQEQKIANIHKTLIMLSKAIAVVILILSTGRAFVV